MHDEASAKPAFTSRVASWIDWAFGFAAVMVLVGMLLWWRRR